MNPHRDIKITINGTAYAVRPSMQLLAEIEDLAGSVMLLGQGLLSGQVKLTTVFNIVRLVTDGKVKDEDMMQDHKACIHAVSAVIMAILNVPLNNAKASDKGEAEPQHV